MDQTPQNSLQATSSSIQVHKQLKIKTKIQDQAQKPLNPNSQVKIKFIKSTNQVQVHQIQD